MTRCGVCGWLAILIAKSPLVLWWKCLQCGHVWGTVAGQTS
jgi:rubredoxin